MHTIVHHSYSPVRTLAYEGQHSKRFTHKAVTRRSRDHSKASTDKTDQWPHTLRQQLELSLETPPNWAPRQTWWPIPAFNRSDRIQIHTNVHIGHLKNQFHSFNVTKTWNMQLTHLIFGKRNTVYFLREWYLAGYIQKNSTSTSCNQDSFCRKPLDIPTSLANLHCVWINDFRKTLVYVNFRQQLLINSVQPSYFFCLQRVQAHE